ncbi:hypothetical protein [Ureibacillus sinduriensis]|uniref:hypothetical protein n=1 Tax=Ureibacillus sinduriensis TaxID=561440 RepID=UPI000B042C38|nr:hypothetical protein [Ureibacillus sinduriensis]
MKRKFLATMMIAFTIELLTTYLVASFFSVRMIEVMFFTGIAFTVIIYFFTSSGGIISNMASSEVSA